MPSNNCILVSQSSYLKDMTFVRQPDEAIVKACYLDQLGLLPALFLRKSGRRQVRQIGESRKLDRVHVDLPCVTRYNRPGVGDNDPRGVILAQFRHIFPILVPVYISKWPPRIHIS